jgi:heme/copper-type cytochrome/quinol oxidase subunit 2
MIKKIKFLFLTVILFAYSYLSGAQKPTLLPNAEDRTVEPENHFLVYIIVIIVIATVVLIAWRTSMRKRKENIKKPE